MARITTLRPVVTCGIPGLDWLWGLSQPPRRFPEFRLVFEYRLHFSLAAYMSQQLLRTQRGRAYFRGTSVLGP